MKTHPFLLSAILLLILATPATAQVSWTAQYMGRGEYRHGFQTPAATNADPAVFVGQRTRLGLKYTHEKFRINISAQDVRTWGQTANGTIDVAGLLSVQEANAELLLHKRLTLKIGRQEIAYDEDRILGGLDWALQARRHDAAIIKYQDSTWKADAGFAYNQDKEQYNTTIYTVASNYKALQYAYVSRQVRHLNMSFLFLNNGMQWIQRDSANVVTGSGVRFSQTTGLQGAYSRGKLGVNASLYGQMGKDVAGNDIAAYETSAEITYKPVAQCKLIAGCELLSGTSQLDLSNKTNHSFAPLYGTNHRFNGYMDLFYVGNHARSVGLVDPYLKTVVSTPRVIAAAEVHYFMAAAPVRNLATIAAMPRDLGTEIDLTFLYKIADGVSLQAGYSHLLPTASFAAVRGGDVKETQNWAYVMLLVRPGLVKFPKSGLKI